MSAVQNVLMFFSLGLVLLNCLQLVPSRHRLFSDRLYVSLCLSVSVCLSVCLSLCLFLSLSLSVCVYVYVCVFICICYGYACVSASASACVRPNVKRKLAATREEDNREASDSDNEDNEGEPKTKRMYRAAARRKRLPFSSRKLKEIDKYVSTTGCIFVPPPIFFLGWLLLFLFVSVLTLIICVHSGVSKAMFIPLVSTSCWHTSESDVTMVRLRTESI